ncbi:hypothetical protein [uncultured Roseobacter sp.]|uniref:hypothetical protein n=1 Tax=uncultured Roseobacter sp. TaxID=114847 RepID=UPI00262F8711|nr:hypothetical protein [uncultured Roseobacter sp.]
MHATLEATFTTRKLEGPGNKVLQIGLFKTPGETRDALIRFSNSNQFVDNPQAGDAHGMAIKILDVPGEKFEPDPAVEDPEKGTFDFILINNETFFQGAMEEYTFLNRIAGDFLNFKRNGRGWFRALVSAIRLLILTKMTDPEMGKAITNTSDQFPASPLFETYFSTTPYMLGKDHAVKYLVKPILPDETVTELGKPDEDENHLNKKMRRGLLDREHRFTLCAQIKRPEDTHLGIEEPDKPWTDAETIALADITIPQREILTDAQWQIMRFGEETRSYNIWNVTAPHRPLGVLNRLRREVYRELHRTRTDFDGDVYE